MSKITNLNDFKKYVNWFDIKNYNCIRDLSIEEIKNQVFYRWEFLSDMENYDLTSEDDEFCLIETNWHKLQKGEVIFSESEMNFDFNEGSLARTQAVRGLSSGEVYCHVNNLLEKGLVEMDGSNQMAYQGQNCLKLLNDYDKVRNMFLMEGQSMDTVSVVLNLDCHTDKEIISDLIELLPKWRNEFNITEPEGIIYAKNKDYEKVAGYRIIALFDLWIWEKWTESTIPLSVLALVLYPLGEKGEKALIDTVIPLAKRLLSGKYRHIDK
jgi:hypothetical protein